MKIIGTETLRILSFFIAMAAVECAAESDEIAVGDSAGQVIDALGQPKGRMTRGGFEILFYGRGTVTLKKGKVSAVELVSPEEASLRDAQRQESLAARQAAAEESRKRRIEEGTAQKGKMLVDEEFLAKPARERLIYWKDFQRLYPEVAVTEQIAELAPALAAEVEAKPVETLSDGSVDAESERKTLDKRILETELEIHDIVTSTNLSRGALIRAQSELKRLREELPVLRDQRSALGP